jgi:hypothetical protein
MSSAAAARTWRTAVGLRFGLASRSSAATAAAWGAAADVPKKFGWASGSNPMSAPKNVVLVPSAAEISGLKRKTGAPARGLPPPSK